jgi:small subunit ribosomal protein S4
MARFRGAKGKIVRKFNSNIFGNPKFDKLLTKRPFPPGQHGQTRRGKLSEYGIQLTEKQKAKYFYGLLEKQFRKYYINANKMKGNTAEHLVQLLEERIDIVVYRAGLAPTVTAARQLVRHGHFTLNGKKVNIPSIQLKKGDVVEVKAKTKEKNLELISNSLKENQGEYEWIEVNKVAQSVKLVGTPIAEVAASFINVNLIIELYSK